MAPFGNQNAVGNSGGRPPKYQDEFAEQAYKLCLLGHTNDELARFFEVGITSIKRWIAEIPEFRAAVLKGREPADAEVAVSLYRRAIGYSHPDVHISTYQGEITETPITKHYPPDTAAATLWLTNRQRDRWKSVQRIEQTGPDGESLTPPVFNIVPVPPKPRDDGD